MCSQRLSDLRHYQMEDITRTFSRVHCPLVRKVTACHGGDSSDKRIKFFKIPCSSVTMKSCDPKQTAKTSGFKCECLGVAQPKPRLKPIKHLCTDLKMTLVIQCDGSREDLIGRMGSTALPIFKISSQRQVSNSLVSLHHVPKFFHPLSCFL